MKSWILAIMFAVLCCASVRAVWIVMFSKPCPLCGSTDTVKVEGLLRHCYSCWNRF